MKAFVGFLWSQKGDYSEWSWNLDKQKLIGWVQFEYLKASKDSVNGVCVSKLFNNFSDIKSEWRLATGNEWDAIENFLTFVENCDEETKQYFIDNQPYDKL